MKRIVDGLDEIYRYKQQMVEHIKNARGCYICTARDNKFDINKDLIVLNNSKLGDLVIYAECKKKAPKHPVNVGLVRQLYGTVEADRVTAGIMVTNSYFSKDARRFQQTIKSRMNLIDYSELMKQIVDCR